MKWLEQFKTPVVMVEGNRFTVASTGDSQDVLEAEVVDAPTESRALVRREHVEPPAQQPTPKVGTIPRHSWGA